MGSINKREKEKEKREKGERLKKKSPFFLFFRFPFLSLFFLLYFLISLLSCVSLSPVDGRVERAALAELPEAVQPQWQPVPGFTDAIGYFAGKVSSPRIEFNALRVDLANPALRILAMGGIPVDDGTFLSTRVSTFVRMNGLLAGINALPFEPVTGREREPRTNIGIVVSNGVMVAPPHHRFDALVFYADGSAAIESQAEMQSGDPMGASIDNAVGGFHRILQDNELVPRVLNQKARHPRSAAGISSDGRFLYLLVIDGRRPGSIGTTEAETALVLRALGAFHGINFDGGGSTSLALRYSNGKVRPVNTPIHRQILGYERAVAGCLGIGLADINF